jgi:hypothetical protein
MLKMSQEESLLVRVILIVIRTEKMTTDDEQERPSLEDVVRERRAEIQKKAKKIEAALQLRALERASARPMKKT